MPELFILTLFGLLEPIADVIDVLPASLLVARLDGQHLHVVVRGVVVLGARVAQAAKKQMMIEQVQDKS